METVVDSEEEEVTDDEQEEIPTRQRGSAEASDSDDNDDDDLSENEGENDAEDGADDQAMVENDHDDNHENEDDKDEDEDEVLTAVVVQDDGDNVDSDDDSTVAVAEAVEIPESKPTKSNTKKKSSSGKKAPSVKAAPTKTKPSKTKGKSEKRKGANKVEVVIVDKKASKKGGKSKRVDKPLEKDKKKSKGTSSLASNNKNNVDPIAELYRRAPQAFTEVANDARAMLRETVPVLPFPVSEAQVKAWGQLCVEVGNGDESDGKVSSKDDRNSRRVRFNSANALYPIGFTCDRYEFSPVHGRVLKMRCSILDGRTIKARHKDSKQGVNSSSNGSSKKILKLHDGPIFRITWGPGIDEDAEKDGEHPYDPNIHSHPIFVNGKGKPINNTLMASAVNPESGMRVKVRCTKEDYFLGSIVNVTKASSKDHSNKKSKVQATENVMVTVNYDHGTEESFSYPDPDLSIVLPGADDELGPAGEVELTEIKGKSVISVIGESPIEAWGRALCRLGLIDEIMLKRALKGLEKTRQDLSKDRASGKFKQKSSSTSQDRKESNSGRNSPATMASSDSYGEATPRRLDSDFHETGASPNKEPPTEREKQLRKRVDDLLADLEAAKEEDREAQLSLANARVRDLGPFMCNPFQDDEAGKAQQASWLVTAVRREKTRMGSTGNKRKIVTGFDLLERNNTFYNADIESLIEGLPGSELCSPYVFQALRSSSGASSRAWAQETQSRSDADLAHDREKEMEKAERARKSQQRAMELQAIRDEIEMEKELKKRKRDELRDERKMQKQAEEEERKRARVDERLSRLEIQINERLYKDAAFQREKVILVMARSMNKEFNRRRRAAELVAGQSVADVKPKVDMESNVSDRTELPGIAKVYDEDIVRVWNFVSTFKSFFLQRGYIQVVPSLDNLQDAINCIKGDSSVSGVTFDDAVSFLTDLAVALCKPLAASLTRMLFASLIALNPALQKDFGATFFNGVNATNAGTEDSADNGGHPDVLLPVNSMTWQEIARLAFLSDALGEMGYSRQETAHLLRGYRSAGHPNSRESKRLRKAEDVPVAILRQKVAERRLKDETGLFSRNRIRVVVPSSPFQDEKATERTTQGKWSWEASTFKCKTGTRMRMGLLKYLFLPSSDYKKLTSEREQYMEEALKLKEEMDRSKSKEDDDEEDDEEDEEEDTTAAGTQLGKEAIEKSQTKETSLTISCSPSNASKALDLDSTNSPNVKEDLITVPEKIGKPTAHDDFCGDIPTAPEVIRRCLAVLRALSIADSAEPFLFPVDPQTNPGYYDMVVRPMCLREVGKQLQRAATICKDDDEDFLEGVVVQFARNVRLIAQNSLSYSNAGPTVIAAASEISRIFERLLLDWVLAPEHALPALQDLDDEKCIEHHMTDEETTQLFCDGCEGKYNMARLDPPLTEIPSGDWYCPRCLSGRCFGSLDPRIGRIVDSIPNGDENKEVTLKGGRVTRSFFSYNEGNQSKPTLMYEVSRDDGKVEEWTLQQIDDALFDVKPIKWVQAVAECQGYGFGIDFGLRRDLVPVPLNPNISDASAQVALSSSVFRDTIIASATLLLVDPREMTSHEWLRLLDLLVMKCASSDVIQNVMSEMEGEAAESMVKPLEKVAQIVSIQDVLPPIRTDIDDVTADESIQVETDDSSPLEGNMLRAKTKSEDDSQTPHTEPLETSPVRLEKRVVHDEVMTTEVETVISADKITSYETGPDGIPLADATPFQTAFAEKNKRQKVIEDSFIAYCIKYQIQPTVASLEEDVISEAVDACLSAGEPGLQFSNLRCRHLKCHFCGLTDTALGLPLVRVPDQSEWEETFAFAARSRRTQLIADVPSDQFSSRKDQHFVSVKIIVDGELLSLPDESLKDLDDGGMLEFVPRSEIGFQNELRFRSRHSLPFVTGSLSAHECCAIAAHNGRKDSLVQKYKERQTQLVEKEAGMFCGRTLEIGRDRFGRSYWKFFDLSDTLFVCDQSDTQRTNGAATWYHFSDSASVASLITSLQRDPVVRDLLRAYPGAQQLIHDRSWPDILLKRRYPNILELLLGAETQSETIIKSERTIRSDVSTVIFKVGDAVFVQSQSEKVLWDARIVAVSKRRVHDVHEAASVDAYRVEYKGWGHRYTEWVKTSRVFKPTDELKSAQDARFYQRTLSKFGFPLMPNQLVALEYLYAKDRARGDVPLPDLARIIYIVDDKNTSLQTFALTKADALAIEAALPHGSIDNSDGGVWSPEASEQWRILVATAEGPASLMRCLIVLEDAISPEWVKEDVGHLRACLPDRWKAVSEASSSSLAIRVILLDRSLKYNKVDRTKFANKSRSKKKK